ncbi:MAG: phytanoyl-CoA dioxygenase family protein [Actinomycetota bacterium]|nr:phytanoyl-CoA dioxygenase family protein [Actinomycetota bacterium]
MTTDLQLAPVDVRGDVETIYRDGITARKGAFPREWVERMRQDMMTALESARKRERGAVSRGPQRWYVEVHPEEISGFAEFVSHPWVKGVSEAVLGPEYKFVEIGFDVPFQGAKNQPWHRDFEMPRETRDEHRLTSLAFNLTGVDVTKDMGPFEIAPGTLWDDGTNWNHGMFPPKEEWARYEPLGVRKFPKMGDISARTALTIHRGTEHPSPTPRPVLILGVVASEVANPDEHDLDVSRPFYESLPEEICAHLLARVVDKVQPITQRHDIEGLVMGVEE